MDDGEWAGRVVDRHVFVQPVAAGNLKLGNWGVQSFAGVDEEVGDFHSQPIQSNNVVRVNLEIPRL